MESKTQNEQWNIAVSCSIPTKGWTPPPPQAFRSRLGSMKAHWSLYLKSRKIASAEVWAAGSSSPSPSASLPVIVLLQTGKHLIIKKWSFSKPMVTHHREKSSWQSFFLFLHLTMLIISCIFIIHGLILFILPYPVARTSKKNKPEV